MSGGRKPERARRPGRRRALAPRERRRHRRRGAAIRLTPAQAPSPPGTAAGSNAVRGPGPPQGGAAEQRPRGTRFHYARAGTRRLRPTIVISPHAPGRGEGKQAESGGREAGGRSRSVRQTHWLLLRSPGWELGAGAPP